MIDWVTVILVVCVLAVGPALTYQVDRLKVFEKEAADKAAAAAKGAIDAVPPQKSDAASALDANFQIPSTDIMSKIVDLHDDLMFFLVVIVLFVS